MTVTSFLSALLRVSIATFLCFGFFVPFVRAEVQSGETCEFRLQQEFAKEQRRFRANVYGLTPTSDAPVGTVRHAKEGKPWYKWKKDIEETLTNESVWVSADGQEITDDDMEVNAEFPSHRGIIATRGVLTSDLVPFIGQSLQAFRCRLDWICNNVEQSLYQSDVLIENLILVPGCMQTTMPTFRQCHITVGGADRTAESDVQTYCYDTVQSVLDQEASILLAVVEYDAAYRSFLQFAGNFDLFLQEFRWPLLTTLRQLLELTTYYGRIPCFLGSCDASPIGMPHELTTVTNPVLTTPFPSSTSTMLTPVIPTNPVLIPFIPSPSSTGP